MPIEVFQSERDAGLEESILSAGAIAYCMPLRGAHLDGPSSPSRIPEIACGGVNLNQPDLHYLNTILVTTGWNNNTDVFDPVETFRALTTPKDKPFNLLHDSGEIIGHITGCAAYDADMSRIDETAMTDLSKLPSKFHIVTSSVLYKVWKDKKLQKRMDTILEEIAEGEWFVSMEAMFGGFDYAMRDESGSTVVVARNKETAFLTKYLRAHKGSGKYENYTIGRLLRKIVFCGKGLVRNPANPESVILDDPDVFDSRTSASEIPTNFQEKLSIPEMPVYSGIAQASGDVNPEIERMKTLEQLTAELADRDTTIASLQSASETNTKTIETVSANLTAAQASIATLEKSLSDSGVEKVALQDQVKALQTAEANTKTALAAANTELATLKAASQRTERLTAIASKLKSNEADSASILESLGSLDAEGFNKHLDFLATTIAARTSAPATAPETPETDKADVNADIKNLETAEASTKGAPAIPSDANADAVKSSIVQFFKKSRKVN